MIWLKVLVLAVVQGLTEFLPVSSSGHLVLARHYFGLGEVGIAFDVLLHLGTMVAIVCVYWKDLLGLVATAARMLRGRAAREERVLLLGLVVGILPVAVVGLLAKDQVEAAFTSPRLAAAMLLVTALLLFVSHRFRHASGTVTLPRALAVGLFQILAILPGVSRSGSTIAGGMIAGVHPREAARFSFLMAVPLFLAAAVLEIPDLGASTGVIPAGAMLMGFVVSFLSGYVAIRWLLATLAKGKFVYFGVYCAVIGILVLTIG